MLHISLIHIFIVRCAHSEPGWYCLIICLYWIVCLCWICLCRPIGEKIPEREESTKHKSRSCSTTSLNSPESLCTSLLFSSARTIKENTGSDNDDNCYHCESDCGHRTEVYHHYHSEQRS